MGQPFTSTVPVICTWAMLRCANTFMRVDLPAPLEKEKEDFSFKVKLILPALILT